MEEFRKRSNAFCACCGKGTVTRKQPRSSDNRLETKTSEYLRIVTQDGGKGPSRRRSI